MQRAAAQRLAQRCRQCQRLRSRCDRLAGWLPLASIQPTRLYQRAFIAVMYCCCCEPQRHVATGHLSRYAVDQEMKFAFRFMLQEAMYCRCSEASCRKAAFDLLAELMGASTAQLGEGELISYKSVLLLLNCRLLHLPC